MLKNRLCARRGFTLTELAIVLGVIGVILGAIWVAASTVTSNQKAQKLTQEITQIVGNMRATFPNGNFDVGAQWFSPLTINNGVIPILIPCSGLQWGTAYGGSGALSGMCGGTPYGVQLIVGTQTGSGGAPATSVNTFEVEFGKLTAAQCQSWMPAFVQAARSNGLLWTYDAGDGPQCITASSGCTPNGPVTISNFQNCSGNVVLQFQL